MIENKEKFNVDQEVEMTLHRIRELDMIYQAIMAGQGHGYDEDSTLDESLFELSLYNLTFFHSFGKRDLNTR